MRSVGLALAVVLSFASTSLTSTAEFDMNYITSMTLPNDAEIVVSEARTYIGRKYCQGILKYKYRQETNGEYDEEGTDTEGWGWGYFAVEIGSNSFSTPKI